jgi:FkbM family methyltransferase
MRELLKKIFFKSTRLLGLDVKRYNLHNSEKALISHIINKHNIEVVLDVGANKGDYTEDLYSEGYAGKAYSFEPIKEIFDGLAKRASKRIGWQCINAGVGSSVGTSVINVSENFASSSLLNVEPASLQAEAKTKFVRTENISITTLDQFLSEEKLDLKTKRTFLKIDVQGYEAEVLKGAENSLELFQFVQMELSFVSLYKGSPDYKDLISFMEKRGFKVFTIIPGFRSPHTGQMLQADAIFSR